MKLCGIPSSKPAEVFAIACRFLPAFSAEKTIGVY